MKIDFLKINGFGKIKEKYIKLEDGINVIYGENESGKSTIVKFILSMFYGASKNKNGKEISDFDKYLPLNSDQYSGKINYSINNEEYEVYRDFKKKMPIIYDKNGNDITKTFPVNKSRESDYFESQSGIDYNTFTNTAVVEQQSIKLDKSDVNSIVQKISNMVETGDDNISYQKSMSKIEKMHLENVGTSKTKNRPINIVKDLIFKYEEEKKSLLNCKNQVEENNEQKNKLCDDLELSNNQKLLIKDFKKYFDIFNVKDAENQYDKNNEQELYDKIEDLKNKKNTTNNLNNVKKVNKFNIVFIILLILISIIMLIFLNNKILLLLPLLILFIDIIVILNKRKNIIETRKDENSRIDKEYEKLLEEYNLRKQKRESKEKEINNEKMEYKHNLLLNYQDKLGIEFINEMFNYDAEYLEKVYDEIEVDIKNISIQIKLLENDKENIDSKLERLTVIEEQLDNLKEEENELKELDISYNIAKECLNIAYDDIKNNLSPKFEEKLCEIVKETTNGEYDKVFLNTENILCVEFKDGSYLPISRLSIGTIDEIYFALRMSVLDEIDIEKMPIIFDEAFVYFDENRLDNAMRYLQDHNYLNQILIFTCTNREERSLRKLNINYNVINLEK